MSQLDSVRAALERHEAVCEDMQRRAEGGCCPSCVFGDEYTRAAEKVGRTRAWLIELLIKESRVSGWPKREGLVAEAFVEFDELGTPRPVGLIRRIILARARDACECRGECGAHHYNGPLCGAKSGYFVARRTYPCALCAGLGKPCPGETRLHYLHSSDVQRYDDAEQVRLTIVAPLEDRRWDVRAHRALCQWCRPKDST